MAKKLRLRFKKDAKETGLRAIGAAPRGSSIIIENKDVGEIKAKMVGFCDYDTSEWAIRIQIPKEENNITKEYPSEWKWATLKYKGSSLEDAQDFVRKNVDRIYELCYKED